MKHIVFGSNGFLGSSLVNKLVINNDVFAIYNNNLYRNNNGAKYIHVNDISLLKAENISTVFYSVGSYSSSLNDLKYLNCILLDKVIDLFPDSKIVFVSSTNVYGAHNEIISENSSFNNPNYYGLSKLAGEFVTQSANRYSIVRLCYLYGNGLNNNSFIPNIINQARNNEVKIFGDGSRKQDYLHIEDAVDILIKSSYCEDNDIFLGATGLSFSNLEIAYLLKKHNKDLIIKYMGEEKGHSLFFNPMETFNKLDFHPTVSISEGITKMWYENINNG